LKQINVLPAIKVGAIDLFLPGWRIGERNKFDRLDNHGGDLLRISIMLLSSEESDKREIDRKNPDIPPCYPWGLSFFLDAPW
jgi:hypothetical protein